MEPGLTAVRIVIIIFILVGALIAYHVCSQPVKKINDEINDGLDGEK